MYRNALLALLCGAQLACGPEPGSPADGSPDEPAADAAPDLLTPDLAPDLDAADLDAPDAAPDLDIPDLDTPDLDTPDLEPQDMDDADAAPDMPAVVPGAPASGDQRLEIGAGRDVLSVLTQADEVRWEAGPQGGYHIWTALGADPALLDGLTEEQRRLVEHRYTIWRLDGTLLAETTRLGGLRDVAGRWVGVGQYAVLEAPVRPRRLDGELLRYRVTLVTPAGSSAWREVFVTSNCCD